MKQYNVHKYICYISQYSQPFYINQLQILISDDDIQSCQVFLIGGQDFNNSRQDVLWQLYQNVQLQNAQYPQITVWDQTANQALFYGVLVGIQPAILGAVNSAQGIKCTIMGHPAKLLYNPLFDYIVAPPGTQVPANMERAGLGVHPQLKDSYGRINISNMANITMATNQTLDHIFIRTQAAIQKIQNKALGATIVQPEIETPIEGLIKSQWKLGQILIPKGFTQQEAAATVSPFVRQLNSDFVSATISGATTLEAIKNALYGDTLLRLTPSGDGSCMYIEPDYLFKRDASDSNTQLKAQDILGLTTQTNVRQKVLQPGTLYVDFTRLCQFLGPRANAALSPSNIYGTYKNNTTKHTYKFIQGPAWITQFVGAETRKNNTQVSSKAQEVYDSYAKYRFFLAYNLSATCLLSLAASDKTLKLKDYIGKTLYINTQDICLSQTSKSLWKNLKGFYCVLSQYRLSYDAAQNERSGSELSINIVVDRFTPVASNMADIFKNGISYPVQFFKKKD